MGKGNGASMRRNFDEIAPETFDLIVVGGGIIGAGIARDAALRGIRTLLLEKDDFGCGTTSRSSRLIHGGLRYLRRLELGLVRQDLRERDILLDIAPHLVHLLPFVIPVSRRGCVQRLALPLGLLAYDLLYPGKSLPSHKRLSRRETQDLEPNLHIDGLVGSYLYYDCQAPFVERLCLENVLAAADNGAVVLNHAKGTGFVRSGSAVSGVQVQDMMSGEPYQVRGRMVVNASGHWVDSVREMLGGRRKPMVRRTKGIHLLTPRLSQNAVVLFALSDQRLFFVIPWEGYSLIGTTDTDYQGSLEAVEADAEDVAYMLTGVQRVFPAVQSADIHYATAGLRSLAGSTGAKTSNVSRDHKLVDHDTTDGIGGLISVLGGKITAYRAVAEQAVDLVCRKLRCQARCLTAEAPLPGAPAVPEQELHRVAETAGLPVGTVTHLAALYGSRYPQVLELASHDSGGKKTICDHYGDILAQVRHAVEEEGALTVADFLLRRSAIGLTACQGLDAVDSVASEMGRLLGWSTDQQQAQVEAYQALAAARRSCIPGQSI
jgi:glycerol-3-phosphate dehydrogenase